MMFGKGLAVREEFDNIFMDYRDETEITSDIRWNDRITYDGTWENNLFNFFTKVTPKLTADLKKSFMLVKDYRVDDSPVHKAVREAFVNLIIHADYLLDAGTLKIIKTANGFSFTNPGTLKLPKEEIYKGGNSKPRNPRMQTMLRMVGFGDNAGSGFPTILDVWKKLGWKQPELVEDTVLSQVTLNLSLVAEENEDENFTQKNERSLSEVLSEVLEEKDYRKLLPIIEYLDDNDSITPKTAEELIEKSSATARRYLKVLVDENILVPKGNTNNVVYIKNIK